MTGMDGVTRWHSKLNFFIFLLIEHIFFCFTTEEQNREPDVPMRYMPYYICLHAKILIFTPCLFVPYYVISDIKAISAYCTFRRKHVRGYLMVRRYGIIHDIAL